MIREILLYTASADRNINNHEGGAEMEDIMKKTYKIEVDCAACALKMEEAAKKVEGVLDATVSFMTQKMKVEFAEGSEEKNVMDAVVKACKKVESDCEIYV